MNPAGTRNLGGIGTVRREGDRNDGRGKIATFPLRVEAVDLVSVAWNEVDLKILLIIGSKLDCEPW